jgi:hypothetical protein
LYLLFAAELGFIGTVIGAGMVLHYSNSTLDQAGTAPSAAALYLVPALMSFHIAAGMVAQMVWGPRASALPLFWKLTAGLILLSCVPFALQAFAML